MIRYTPYEMIRKYPVSDWEKVHPASELKAVELDLYKSIWVLNKYGNLYRAWLD